MPRIEIIPAGWETSQAKADGDGTPTEDVCRECGELIHEGDDVQKVFIKQSGTIGATDVEHPSYEEDDYRCAQCGCKLTDDDDD